MQFFVISAIPKGDFVTLTAQLSSVIVLIRIYYSGQVIVSVVGIWLLVM